MDARLKQMLKARIEFASKEYMNKVRRVFDEIDGFDKLVVDLRTLPGGTSIKKANFGPLELELKSIRIGCEYSGYSEEHYRNVNFKGKCVLSFYDSRSCPDEVRSYIPGQWEAEFERAYLLAETRYNSKLPAEAKEALREQELEDAELLKRFGLGPKS